jgi:predicted nucleic acid-binding protein
MTGPCFVDANVLLYSRDPRDPAKQARANAWLDVLWREGRGHTSMQVLSEFYYNATRKLNPAVPFEDAWARASTFFAWNPQPIDTPLLRRARVVEERWRLSWWDSMIVAAAQLQGCALLLTEDLQDGAVYGTVTVRSPFTLDVHEPAAQYAMVPSVGSRHRPRGRPRRSALA